MERCTGTFLLQLLMVCPLTAPAHGDQYGAGNSEVGVQVRARRASTDLTEAQRQACVARQNELRAQVSPTATDMGPTMALAESNVAGCGVHHCPEGVTLTESPNATYVLNGQAAWMVTRGYFPAGNSQWVKPYISGSSCTQCSSGVGYCLNNTCENPTTTAASLKESSSTTAPPDLISSTTASSPPITATAAVSPPITATTAVSPPATAALSSPITATAAVSPPITATAAVSPPVTETAAVSPPITATAAVSTPITATAAVSPPITATAAVSPPITATAAVSPPATATAAVLLPATATAALSPPITATAAAATLITATAAVSPPITATAAVSPPITATAAVSPPATATAAVSPPITATAAVSPPITATAALSSPITATAALSSPATATAAVSPPITATAAVSPPITATAAAVSPQSTATAAFSLEITATAAALPTCTATAEVSTARSSTASFSMAGLSMAALSTAPPCELVCENGGVLNFLDCGCRCASGYQGTTCQYNILNPDLVNDAVIASHDDVRQQLSAVDNTVNLLSVEPANTDPTATSTIISPPFSANDGHCSRCGSACQFVRFLSRVFPSLDFNSYPSYKGSYEYVRSDPYVRDSNISKPIIDSGYALPGTYGELLWRSRSNLLTFREPRPMPDNYFLY